MKKQPNQSIQKPRSTSYLLSRLLVIILSVSWLAPIFFTVLMSFRPENEAISQGNIFFGTRLTLENYLNAWAVAPWGWHYANSLIFVLGVLVVQLVTTTLAGYSFARLEFRGKNILLALVLSQLLIPTVALIVQNFSTIQKMGIFDTHIAMMIPYWGSAFGTFLLRQAFRDVPYELDEAAKLDGAKWWQLLRYVYVPLTIPTYVAFSLVSISAHWNEFLWPFIITRSEEVRPLTVGLNKLLKTTEFGALYSQLMAGTVMVILPLILLFLVFQKQFIESFAHSGIKS